MRRTWVIGLAILAFVVSCGGNESKEQVQAIAAVPSATASPTATPSPSPSPSPTPNAIADYRTKSAQYVTQFEQELDRLAEITRTVATENASWRQLFQGANDRLQSTSTAVEQLSAPSCFSAAHQALKNAADKFRAAGSSGNYGLQQNNSGIIVAVPRIQINDGRLQLSEHKRLMQAAQCT